jgi:hydrogenase-4 component F
MAWILPLLLIPLLAGLACLLLKDARLLQRVALAGAALTGVAAFACAGRAVIGGEFLAGRGWVHADGLAALVLVICGIALPATVAYGHDYMGVLPDLEPGDAGWVPGRWEALVFALATATLLSAVANNLGLLWVALEGATLASAVLVGYYRSHDTLEAAWKYLVLCSVGVALALFATVLLYYSAVPLFGMGGGGMQWSALRAVAPTLEPRFVKLAFLFALVGYGTKVGLAPMHSWVPDAYSRSPAPATALLATALSAASVAALLRFFAIARATLGPVWPEHLLALFGALSMVLAVPFLLVQGEYKRLLAWSAVKHTGFVVLAVGLGTPLALFGGLLHLLVQSLAKALGFMLGGTLLRASGSRRLDHVSGVLAADRTLGTLLLVAGAGVAGLPPAGTFVSEWLALAGGFAGPRPAYAIVALAALASGFIGITFHWSRMLMGKPREGGFRDRLPRSARVPMWSLAVLLVTLGVWLPSPLRLLLECAMRSVRP